MAHLVFSLSITLMCQALLFVFATFFTFLLSFFFFPRCTTTINDVVLLLWLLLLLLLLLLLRLTSLCTSDNFKHFVVHENCFCQEFCAPNLCISNMRMNAEFDFNSLLLLAADSSIIIATVVCVRKPKNVVGTRIEKYFLTDMLMANRRSERIICVMSHSHAAIRWDFKYEIGADNSHRMAEHTHIQTEWWNQRSVAADKLTEKSACLPKFLIIHFTFRNFFVCVYYFVA